MKTRGEREVELLSSNLVAAIKNIFATTNADIPEKYYLLIADYIEAIS